MRTALKWYVLFITVHTGIAPLKADEMLLPALIALILICPPALSAEPANPAERAYNRAQARFDKSEFVIAVHELNRAIKLGPRSARAYYLRARCEHTLGAYQRAYEDCNKAISLEPNGNTLYYFQRAMASMRLHKIDEALKDCDLVIKREPNYIGAYLIRADLRYRKGQYSGAILDCDKVRKLNPNNEEVKKLRQRLMKMP